MKTALGTAGPEALILEVDGEQITLDESFMENLGHDLTAKDMAFLAETVTPQFLAEDGEPTVGLVALMMTVKLGRDRPHWTDAHFEAVLTLLTAWLTDSLVEVEEV